MPTDDEDTFAIDAQDLELLKEKHPGFETCPVCENTEWFIMQDTDQRVAMLPESTINKPGSIAYSYPLVAVSCQRCGFLKLHIKQTFDDYIESLKNEQ